MARQIDLVSARFHKIVKAGFMNAKLVLSMPCSDIPTVSQQDCWILLEWL